MKITGLLHIENKLFTLEMGYDKAKQSETIAGVILYPYIAAGVQVWKLSIQFEFYYIKAIKWLDYRTRSEK